MSNVLIMATTTEQAKEKRESDSTIESLRWAASTLRDNLDLLVIFAFLSLILAGIEIIRPPDPGVASPLSRPGAALLSVLGFTASGIPIGYAFYTAYDTFHEETTKHSKRLIDATKRLPIYLVTFIIWSLLVGIGFLLLVIPGIYLLLKLSMAWPAMFIDNMGPIKSLKYSWGATSDHLLTILGVFVAFIIAGLIATGVGMIVPYGNQVISIILNPLFALAFGYLYLTF